MSKVFTIMDGAIGHVWDTRRNVNGVPGITYYFTRKTTAENLPIEISFIRYSGEIQAVCRQDANVVLEAITISGEKYTYDNNILFDKAEIELILDSIEEETVAVSTVDTLNEMFGIDLSHIDNINGLEFNKLVYIDRLDMDFNISDYFEGYMIVLNDIATNSLKLGIFVGTLSAYTYREYLDEVNEIGQNAILDMVSVDNQKNKTLITNNNKYRIELDLTKYRYNVQRAIYPDKHYSREDIATLTHIIEPGETVSFEHEVNQREVNYTLLSNPITPPTQDIYVSDSDTYLANLDYIREEPFEISLSKIVSPIGANDPGQFNIISTVFDLFKDSNDFSHAIVDSSYDNTGLEVKGPYGKLVVSDDEKFEGLVRTGGSGTFLKHAKVIFKTKLRKIYSALGEDIFNAQFDYMLAEGKIRIMSIESTVAYNDSISTPIPSLNVNFGFFASYDDVMTKSRHIEYKNVIYKSDLPCKGDRDAAIKRITGTTVFRNNYVEFSINDVLKFPSKKLYMGSLYKTYNAEVDDAYAFYQETVLREINGYSMATVPLSLTSNEIAAVEPLFDIRGESQESECFETFTYDQQEDIGALGIEVAMEDVLTKIKRSMYIFRQEDELVASFNLGLSFDKEWYYCGEDFFPAKSIDEDTFTTYLDNEIVSLSRDNDTPYRHIYDKKIFFDSTDYTDEYKEQLHDAFRALVVGDINVSTIHDNPGLEYITSHLLDRNNKRYFSYEEMLTNASSVVFRSTQKKLNNTMLMPNIFEQMVIDEKSGYSSYVGQQDIHKFGKMREEYKVNYADLKVADAYDSAYEIGHAVNLMFNKDMLHLSQNLLSPVGKSIFGLEFSEFTIADRISVDKVENYSLGDSTFAFAVVFSMNEEDVFAVAYDYRTKELKFDNIGGIKIVDYTLLIASFDIFLHDFYKDLDGKARVSLGIYDFAEEAEDIKDELSKSYLLINSAASSDKQKANVFAVRVGSFDASLYLEVGGNVESQVMLDTQVGNEVVLSALLTEDGLIVTKGVQTLNIPMSKLELSPSDRIVENGISVEVYRSDLFLPNRFFGDSLTEVTVEVTEALTDDKTIKNMVGDVVVIPYGDTKKFYNAYGQDYNFVVDGEGFKFWKKYDEYSTRTEILEDIDTVMNHKDEERLYNINNLVCKVTFK